MDMRTFIKTYPHLVAWTLGGVTLAAALIAWLLGHQPSKGLSLYSLFPPLGLIAFGLMWTHFILGALRSYAGVTKPMSGNYMTVSMGIVLALLLLHPILLWTALFIDGFGLPPLSAMTVYQSQQWAIILGSISLAIFLAFELKRWFKARRWWAVIEWLQVIGMGLIFFHALELGGELKLDWFRAIWWLYGISLVAAIVYTNVIARNKEMIHAGKIN